MIEVFENTYYYPESQSVLMHLDLPETEQLPPEVVYSTQTFQLKSEFHITLCALKEVSAVHRDSRTLKKFLDTFSRELLQNTVTVGDMKPRLSLCSKDKDSKSIITPIDVLGLQESIVRSRQDAPTMPLPYPHVTLYTLGDPRGVGVHSNAQYAERCKHVSIPAVESFIYAPARL